MFQNILRTESTNKIASLLPLGTENFENPTEHSRRFLEWLRTRDPRVSGLIQHSEIIGSNYCDDGIYSYRKYPWNFLEGSRTKALEFSGSFEKILIRSQLGIKDLTNLIGWLLALLAIESALLAIESALRGNRVSPAGQVRDATALARSEPERSGGESQERGSWRGGEAAVPVLVIY